LPDLCLPLVPYLKKGAKMRHYCRPSVEAQMYFMTFAVLLAPWLERVMEPCSFGNRWFRGVYRKTLSDQKSAWTARRFALEDKNAYQPYPRAYGLFRRVAHWTSQAMVGEKRDDTATAGHKAWAPSPDDYAEGSLPAFVRSEWWRKASLAKGDTERGYWAEIDLELAYPSIAIDKLRVCLEEIVEVEVAPVAEFLDYPLDIMRQIERLQVRLDLVQDLCAALQGVTYETSDAPGDLWLPPDVQQTMPRGSGEDHPGLPTGLMISGLLLNAYLYPVDKVMMEWCDCKPEGRHEGQAAFLRFADDMRVMATSPETLFKGIDTLWQAICCIGSKECGDVYLSRPDQLNASNLRINLAKLGPEPVRQIVEEYLLAEGWQENPKTSQLSLPEVNRQDSTVKLSSPQSLSTWWKKRKCSAHIDALDRKALTEGYLNAFVTHLVERMSELGSESLDERFGAQARQRLTDLHQLVRFEIDDKQVRADTRLAFGTGKLVRAWLPEHDVDEDRLLIREIRESVSLALHQAPWKTSLWRAVLRAAVRRPCGGEGESEKDEKTAERWLRSQLELIQHPLRVEKRTQGHGNAWWSLWPEEGPAIAGDTEAKRKHQALSAHRAAFWYALRDTLTEIDRAIEATQSMHDEQIEVGKREWSSRNWTFRALPQESLVSTRSWLARLDVWCALLYPSEELSLHRASFDQVKLTRYETEALSLAVLCTQAPLIFLAAMHDAGNEIDDKVTSASLCDGSVSSWAGWVVEQTGASDDKLRHWVKLLLPVSQTSAWKWPDHAYELVRLVPDSKRSKLFLSRFRSIAMADHAAAVRRLRQLRMQRSFPEAAHEVLRAQAHERLDQLYDVIENPSHQKKGDFWLLREYAWVRQALLGYNDPGVKKNKADRFSLHRLLWGAPWSHQHAARWRIEPAGVTTVGLPLRIACHLLEHVLRRYPESPGSFIGDPPVWLLNNAGSPSPRSWLAAGRRCQFGVDEWSDFEARAVPVTESSSRSACKWWVHCPAPADRRESWEVLPHPLYLMPGILPSEMDAHEYDRWCHLLLFLTAVQGDEKMLDILFEWGAGSIPFEERWHWRHHIHMPQVFWKEFERLCRRAFGRSDIREEDSVYMAESEGVLTALQKINTAPLRPLDFRWERVDIQLTEKDPWDLPVAVLPYGHVSAQMHEKVATELAEQFSVRMGQISEHPNWKTIVQRGLRLDRKEIQAIMRQVSAVFLHEAGAGKNGSDVLGGEMVVLPEATLPNSERKTIMDWARQSRRAVLAGCFWRTLGTVVPPHIAFKSNRVYLSNEALLALPLSSNGDDDWAPVRQFTIQKPMPAHLEFGLARALSPKADPDRSWHMNMGARWYLFAHPRWGKFTVAICSDLIDPAPWNNLRGEIQHLITCAYNKDVDLYEAMTWVRAYENFTNVVLVNHGEYGGSFVWTPKHKGKKEVVKLRGTQLNLIADVVLPVKDLVTAQKHGVEYAIAKAEKDWCGSGQLSFGIGCEKVKDFKAPPPGYLSRG